MAAIGLGRAVPRRSTAVLALLAAVLAVAAGAVAASVFATGTARAPLPALAELGEAREAGDAGDAREAGSAGLGRSIPVRIAIPAIGVAAEIRPVRLVGEELAAPPEASLAGWYAQGTSPGELGSAVIVGHAGPRPGVFTRLPRLAPGDVIEVVREDGVTATFVVDRVAARSHRKPVRDTGGEAQLRLVPKYRAGVPAAGQVVVFATLASTGG
jgi:hypothetical protein